MILQNYQNFTEMYHLLWTTNRNLEYCISANSFRGNYSFLKLTLCTVTFDHSTYRCENYSREETIQGRKLFAEIRYLLRFFVFLLLCIFGGSGGGGWQFLLFHWLFLLELMDLLVLFPWERYWAGTLTNFAATPFVNAIATLIEKIQMKMRFSRKNIK